jgi:hypothetical protein
MNYINELENKFEEIVKFVDLTISNFSKEEKEIYDKNITLVNKNVSSIEKENSEIRRLNKFIENIKKDFFRENGFVVLGLVIGIVLSFFLGTTHQSSLIIIVIVGIYLLYKNSEKDREILEQSNKINTCNGTISIFKRDLNILGVENFCIENLIKYRNKDNDFYTDDFYPELKNVEQSIRDRVGCSIVISDYQIKLFTIKFTFDSLGSSYDKDLFKKYLSSSYLN